LDIFLQQGDEEEIEGLTNSFDDEEATPMTPLDNLTVKLQEIRRRYYSVSMCRVKPKGAGFTRIRAPEVEPSMGPNPVKPTPEGFIHGVETAAHFLSFSFFSHDTRCHQGKKQLWVSQKTECLPLQAFCFSKHLWVFHTL
jgi:hypothetical protein